MEEEKERVRDMELADVDMGALRTARVQWPRSTDRPRLRVRGRRGAVQVPGVDELFQRDRAAALHPRLRYLAASSLDQAGAAFRVWPVVMTALALVPVAAALPERTIALPALVSTGILLLVVLGGVQVLAYRRLRLIECAHYFSALMEVSDRLPPSRGPEG